MATPLFSMDVLVSASDNEISTLRGDIYGQWSFSTRSTLTDLDVCACFCKVEISLPEAESSTPNENGITSVIAELLTEADL